MILLKYLTASSLKIKLRMLASALMTSEIGESVVVSPYYFFQGCPLSPPLAVVWRSSEVGKEGGGGNDYLSLRLFCDFSYPWSRSYKFQNYWKKYANLWSYSQGLGNIRLRKKEVSNKRKKKYFFCLSCKK